ncbi:MAG: GNAT family N-acetyltransferase [Planctomycetota bacterium]
MIELGRSSGLFEDEQVQALADIIRRHFAGQSERQEIWVGAFDGREAHGLAYGASEMMTDRVWNLLFVAVRPDQRGSGIGNTLIEAVEERLRRLDTRMVIVETTNGADFVAARGLYTKHGYEQEGTVRDFYAQGQDKITFRKLL